MKNEFIHLPMKMNIIECSETSDFRTQAPGKYTKENILHFVVSLSPCVLEGGF